MPFSNDSLTLRVVAVDPNFHSPYISCILCIRLCMRMREQPPPIAPSALSVKGPSRLFVGTKGQGALRAPWGDLRGARSAQGKGGPKGPFGSFWGQGARLLCFLCFALLCCPVLCVAIWFSFAFNFFCRSFSFCSCCTAAVLLLQYCSDCC